MNERCEKEMSRLSERWARRDVLKAAAALAGTSVLGLASSKTFALGGQKGGRTLAIAYWDGTRFVEASALERGDASLADVVLRMRGFGSDNALLAMDAIASVPDGKSLLQVPFKAWTAPPKGAATTRFQMPVSPANGLEFRGYVSGKSGEEAVSLRLLPGSGAGPKLMAGTYLVLAQPTDWTRLRLDPVEASPLKWADGSAAEMAYLLIDVERA